MSNKKGRGLTLTELIVVIIIIAILITLALPQFSATRERALGKEARANLRLISAAEKIYQMEVGFYYPYSGSSNLSANEINTALKLSVIETNWDYSIQSISGNGRDYTAFATRQEVPGHTDCQYTMIQSDTGPIAGLSCPY